MGADSASTPHRAMLALRRGTRTRSTESMACRGPIYRHIPARYAFAPPPRGAAWSRGQDAGAVAIASVSYAARAHAVAQRARGAMTSTEGAFRPQPQVVEPKPQPEDWQTAVEKFWSGYGARAADVRCVHSAVRLCSINRPCAEGAGAAATVAQRRASPAAARGAF